MSAVQTAFEQPPASGTVLEVSSGVFWVRMPMPFPPGHINVWLLQDGDGWTLVDTGVATPEVKEHWETIFTDVLQGQPITRVILTHFHPDHIGCAGWIFDRFRPRLLMTRTEWLMARASLLDVRDEPPALHLEHLTQHGVSSEIVEKYRANGYGAFGKIVSPFPDQYIRMVDGGVLTIGSHKWQVIIGRGHAPEHACLYSETAGVLISGDQIINGITPHVGVSSFEPEAQSLTEFMDTLRLFVDFPEDVLTLASHKLPFYNVGQRAQDLLDYHDGCLNALVDHVARTPSSAADLVETLLQRPVNTKTIWDTILGLSETLAHLNHLVQSGRIVRQVKDDKIIFAGA